MDKQKLLETIEELRKQLAFMQEKYQLLVRDEEVAGSNPVAPIKKTPVFPTGVFLLQLFSRFPYRTK